MLLLAGVMRFVAVGTAVINTLAPYVRVIKNPDVCSTIDQTPMYGLLESVLGTKGG